MTKPEIKNAGVVLQRYRQKKGISASEVARRADINQSTVTRLELGTHNPSMEVIGRIASVVGAPLTEVLAAANLIESDDLPAFTPYLRTKYKHLPPEARRDIAAHFKKIADDYGITELSGPKPGEDE